MLCFLVMLCSLCTLQLLCEILSVFLEQTVILTHLLLELTGAALNLSFAELALCGRLCAADNGIRIIIDLADVGHWSLYILAVIVIILLNDRRKLGVRSACKNVIGKRCRRLRNLSHGSLLKLLCISVISAYILLESALALICVLTKCLCCLKAFGVKVENASLVFSALCKSFKLFVLILGESVLLISLCKLLLETGNDTVVILDLLLKKRGRKQCKACCGYGSSCKRRNRRRSSISCRANVCNAIGNGSSIAGFLAAHVVDDHFGFGDLLNDTASYSTVKYLLVFVVLGNNARCLCLFFRKCFGLC